MDEISDVEGLYPTFVMNVLPASALSVAKNNDIGNTWGLDDDQSYICKLLHPFLKFYPLRPSTYPQGQND